MRKAFWYFRIASLPVRLAVDVVKAPAQLVNGDDFLENTIQGVKRIETDLND